MLNHPYSFDSYAQMGKYFGEYNWGNTTEFDDLLKSDISGKALSTSVYGDGAFTNRSEMTLKYFIEHDLRPAPAPQDVPDAVETLERLGYYK